MRDFDMEVTGSTQSSASSNARLDMEVAGSAQSTFPVTRDWIWRLLEALSRALPVTLLLYSPFPGSSALRDDPAVGRAARGARGAGRCPLPPPQASRGRAAWSGDRSSSR